MLQGLLYTPPISGAIYSTLSINDYFDFTLIFEYCSPDQGRVLLRILIFFQVRFYRSFISYTTSSHMQFNTYETYYYTRIIKALIFAHFIYLSSKSIKFLNIRYFILILLIRYSYRLSSAFSLNYDMLSVSLIILSC